MSARLAVPAVAALAAAAALAPSASAVSRHAAPPCPRYAGVVSHGIVGQLDGAQGNASTPHTGPLTRLQPYVATTAVRFTVAGNTYRVAKGTVFSIGCYGPSVKTPKVLYPSVLMQRGSITLKTATAKPGAIFTLEALINPVGHTAQRIVVTRRQAAAGGAVRVNASGPKVDLTPEVGAHAGHCIYWNHAKLVSRWDQRRQDFDLRVSATR